MSAQLSFVSVLLFIGNIHAFIPRVANLNSLHTVLSTSVPRFSISLNAWGVQKLGQSVINRNTTSQVVIQDEESVLRFRPSVGSGADERLLTLDPLADVEEGFATLSNIEMGFKKYDLLLNLKSAQPLGYKLDMIGTAIGADDLLPSSLMATSAPRMSKPAGAGLLKDWAMEI